MRESIRTRSKKAFHTLRGRQMGAVRPIRVMISSRCEDGFPESRANSGKSLTEWRRELKEEIEGQTLFGQRAFDVWINEDAAPAAGAADSWEACIEQVRDCDILLVLANGSAGWGKDAGDIGICHAEYMEGLNTAPGKVFVVRILATEKPRDRAQQKRDERFVAYLEKQSAFRGGTVKTGAQLKARVQQALHEAVSTLVRRGVREASASRFDRGDALDWSRLDFSTRAARMRKSLNSCLSVGGSSLKSDLVARSISGVQVGFQLHAIPAGIGISAAREMVGRPFLRDHERVKELGAASGPVHLIACHKGATETQAISLLGFPDATVISGSFGVYVADDVQKVQFVFLSNCRDETNLRHQQQRFFEWLEQTDEGEQLARRATSRVKIIKAIATELK